MDRELIAGGLALLALVFGIILRRFGECEHRYDLADIQPRGHGGIMSCRCYKCGAIHFAEYGLALPGTFDRNSNAGVPTWKAPGAHGFSPPPPEPPRPRTDGVPERLSPTDQQGNEGSNG